jgi:tRNA dimethylallyltransferase
MVEVAPDTGLRNRLEKKTIEELTGILAAMKSLHNTTDIDTKKRLIRAIEIEHFSKNRKANKSQMPQINSLVIGIMIEREKRRQRISQRLKQRIEAGMVEEVKRIIDSGVDPEIMIYYGLEYKYITLYLTGNLTYDRMISDLEIAIHQFAKRQMTWFRGMEKKGTKIHWIDGELPMKEKVNRVIELLNSK